MSHWPTDLADFSAAKALIAAVEPALVFNLAGEVTGRQELSGVVPTFLGNLATHVYLLTACTQYGCRRVVSVGSLVEPDPGGSEVAGSPYAAAKCAASDYTRMFYQIYGLSVTIARVFMVYGPGDQHASKLIPYLYRCFSQGLAPHLSSGQRLIDWIHVDDVVDGLLAIARAGDLDGRSIDLGSGVLTSIRELVGMVGAILGSSTAPIFEAALDRPHEPTRSARVGDTQRLVGWAPRIDLETGLRSTLQAYASMVSASTAMDADNLQRGLQRLDDSASRHPAAA